MFDLSGKTALVTGSTQGIGLSIAKLLAENGAKVYVNGATSLEKCVNACKVVKNSSPVLANLLRKDDIDRMFDETGGVDILVLNASIQYKREWDEYTEEEYDVQLDCNLKSSYRLLRKYVPYMKEQKYGRIVTVGSVNQYNNHPMLSLYGVTKAAQFKMVQNLAPDLARYSITINNVSPGAIMTPRNKDALSDPLFYDKVVKSIPVGYIGVPDDISPAVLLLCSEEGRYITGADLKIDGGMSL